MTGFGFGIACLVLCPGDLCTLRRKASADSDLVGRGGLIKFEGPRFAKWSFEGPRFLSKVQCACWMLSGECGFLNVRLRTSIEAQDIDEEKLGGESAQGAGPRPGR